MSRRGYLETQGSTKRLRIVRAGYDADNLSVPANATVFDSLSNGGLPVIYSGVYSLSGDKTAYNPPIATWPNLGFIPFGWALVEVGGEQTQITAGARWIEPVFTATGLKLRAQGWGAAYPILVYYAVSSVAAS